MASEGSETSNNGGDSQQPNAAENLIKTINLHSQLITVHLDEDNYLLWKLQIGTTIRGYGLDGFILGTQTTPPEHIPPIPLCSSDKSHQETEANSGNSAPQRTLFTKPGRAEFSEPTDQSLNTSAYQRADILTKALSSKFFARLRTDMKIQERKSRDLNSRSEEIKEET